MRIDAFEKGIELRKKIVRGDKVLCAEFAGTLQEEDIKKRNDMISDVLNGKYCYRAKIDVKAFDDNERKKKNLPPFDFSDENAIKEALKGEFDMPLWFLRAAGEDLKNIKKYNLPFIHQVRGCTFHDGTEKGGCIYCFVDNKNNSGEEEGGVWLSAENVVETYKQKGAELNIHRVRISGGEPTLVLDHILRVQNELAKKCSGTRIQFDSNLSTGRLIDYFIGEGIYEKNILEKIAEHDPKVLVAFKGTDCIEMQQNVQAKFTIEDMIYSLEKFVKAGIDVYPYMYNPNPKTLETFIVMMEKKFENILPKIHIGKLNTYEPTKMRIRLLAPEVGKSYEELLAYYEEKWKDNFAKCEQIMDNLLHQGLGVSYKELERPGIKLKLKN